MQRTTHQQVGRKNCNYALQALFARQTSAAISPLEKDTTTSPEQASIDSRANASVNNRLETSAAFQFHKLSEIK
ncbi:MAG: hypothetical protein IT311_06480 [Anaerolineales bacterium]|nr:hypothetical protein [Anaerolineales bacterium]MCZ2122244.1 hypothetical protein [Anaerolineales bacterium]